MRSTLEDAMLVGVAAFDVVFRRRGLSMMALVRSVSLTLVSVGVLAMLTEQPEHPVRWRFLTHGSPKEKALRESQLKEIDRWWTTFRKRSSDLHALFKRQQEWDLAEWMSSHLHAIDPRLMWEFGPGSSGGHRLVITPEADRELRPFVEVLLGRAPELDGWEFYAHRLPESPEDAELMLEARGLPSLGSARAVVSEGAHHTVDLVFCSEDFNEEEDPAVVGAAFVSTEVILGERWLDTWVGAIEAEKGMRDGAVPLTQLRDRVTNVIATIRESLPDRPVFEIPDGSLEWTLWELQTEEHEDYPQRLDLYTARSMLPEMWSAAHTGAIFYSERFSRHGETFCYVKLDGTPGEWSVERKSSAEEALGKALRQAQVGAVVGGGAGRRYWYIDLALQDVDRGIEIVRRVLGEKKVPKRSWILFFDGIYASEWVGVHDETPAPPR